MVGAATNWYIRATVYAALDRGYDLTLVEDVHTRETIELDHGLSIEAADALRELNTVMTWLGYPDRKSGTALAEEVGLAVSGGVR